MVKLLFSFWCFCCCCCCCCCCQTVGKKNYYLRSEEVFGKPRTRSQTRSLLFGWILPALMTKYTVCSYTSKKNLLWFIHWPLGDILESGNFFKKLVPGLDRDQDLAPGRDRNHCQDRNLDPDLNLDQVRILQHCKMLCHGLEVVTRSWFHQYQTT